MWKVAIEQTSVELTHARPNYYLLNDEDFVFPFGTRNKIFFIGH